MSYQPTRSPNNGSADDYAAFCEAAQQLIASYEIPPSSSTMCLLPPAGRTPPTSRNRHRLPQAASGSSRQTRASTTSTMLSANLRSSRGWCGNPRTRSIRAIGSPCRPGPEAGVVATATVQSEPEVMPGDVGDPYLIKAESLSRAEPRVVLHIESVLSVPIRRTDLVDHAVLQTSVSSGSRTRRTSRSRRHRTKRSRRSCPACVCRRSLPSSKSAFTYRELGCRRHSTFSSRRARLCLRPAGNRQDLRRACARRGDDPRGWSLPDRPVSSVVQLRGLHWWFPAGRGGRRSWSRVRAYERSPARMAASAAADPGHPYVADRRRDQSRQHPEDLWRASLPARVPPEGRPPPVLARRAVQPPAESLLDRHDEHGRSVDCPGRCRASPAVLLRAFHPYGTTGERSARQVA